MIKVPANYSRCGIKVKCLKCKWTVKETCRLTSKGINTCKYKDKHKYIMIAHVPGTKKKKRMQITNTKKFDQVMLEFMDFKNKLASSGYSKALDKKKILDTSFEALMVGYINSISGAGTHAHLSRNLSPDYLKEVKGMLLTFCKALKEKGYIIEKMDLKDIGDDEVEILHNYLKKKTISETYYAKHFVVMKTFVNWVIKVKGYEIVNVFRRHKLHFPKGEKNYVTPEEFQRLIEVITYENGAVILKDGKRKNNFRSWLSIAIKLGLETGLRREEIFALSWNNIREIPINGQVCRIFDINNLKNMRQGAGKFLKPIPITLSLYELLMDLGYEEKKGSEAFIIERDAGLKIDYLTDDLTRGFAHFIKMVTNRKLQFKDLRKTYISYLSEKLGDKTKLFTGHGDDQVIRDHYISHAFIAAKLSSLNLFGSFLAPEIKENPHHISAPQSEKIEKST